MKLHTKKRKLTREEQKEKDRARKKIIFLAYIKPTLRWYFRQFKSEENPLFAWRAYQFCRQKNDVPLPEWVLKYFDEVAKDLLDSQGHRLSSERTGVFIQKALKMNKKGRDDIFQRYFDVKKKMSVIGDVINLQIEEEKTRDTALYQIENETGIPYDTLIKWYYRYREILLKPA